ncbi:hypothetical protein [Paenibacillus daejeonensis]|uniref:exo-rhamnogalacturonan lyase family protein n=1 Tax=Paenibacillus daejeonensis TaxID=135193 RepID=UPI00036BFB85|nr:hypothetical protein [Paenibacillus daejeonensis]
MDSKGQNAAAGAAELAWLGNSAPSAAAVGTTWGVPWHRGELHKDEPLALLAGEERLPLQSWPTAYWPDGSVKWTAHASVFGPAHEARLRVVKGESVVPAAVVTVVESESEVWIDTGAISCRLGRTGSELIRELSRGSSQVCSGGRLVVLRERRGLTAGLQTTVEEPYDGTIESVQVEQAGPLRAVIRVAGRHRAAGAPGGQRSGGPDRRWLPFTVRLYFYAGTASIRLMHTVLYDGNPHQDYVKGIGIRLSVPMRGELYNRHIRFKGDTGWFAESPQGLMTHRLTDPIAALYRSQREGRPIAFDREHDADFLRLLDDVAIWDSYRLVQHSPDAYSIAKRTGEGCSWLPAVSGRRAGGMLYAGGEDGGLAAGVRHFWQQAPAALEVAGASTNEAELTVWLWPPDVPAMDLRHYDTRTHVASAYEGADELRSTPYGVGHTSECMIWCCERTPSQDELDGMDKHKEYPVLPVCEPARYHSTQTLGIWSLRDDSTPARAAIEEKLDEIIAFYQAEIEQRGWYGFWNYGDVMHSYDPVRHTWRYDIGGCAWQNAELVPNIWLWYMFLRSGRADLFRMAEAMTRHTSETDTYHIGEYAGLGSRHNVIHWGCGCKEARIAMAGLHRYYYYLTADERIGEIMDEVKDADFRTVGIDPMRAYMPRDEHPTHARSGPDWAAFASNWMVQWERYEDTGYRDKIKRGIASLKQAPHRLLTGPVFGYDPKTSELAMISHENYGHHLMICMGGAQVWMELAEWLEDEEWSAMLAEFGAFYTLPPEEKQRRTGGDIPGKDWNIPMLATAMMAYASERDGGEALADEAWQLLLQDRTHWGMDQPLQPQPVPLTEYPRAVKELPWISTNTASQWSINVIVCLELIGERLPGNRPV